MKQYYFAIKINEVYRNYKDIEEGIYCGKVIDCFLTSNRKNEDVLSILLEYYSKDVNDTKCILANYNLVGASRVFCLNSLLPIFTYYGIVLDYNYYNCITPNIKIVELCCKLKNETVYFKVEKTSTNKNIRLISPTIINK